MCNDGKSNWINYEYVNNLKMIDKISEGILTLNSFVSNSEVDSYLRNQAIMILTQAKESTPEVQICQQYITLMEDTHDKMVQKIRVFIDTFSSHFADFQTNLQTIQQDLQETNRVHSQEKTENQNIVEEMSKRIEHLNKQIFSKEEEIRQLNIKLQERDIQIDTSERQSNDYLTKMENDFYRHQKALEDSYEIITRLEEQIYNLKKQNEHLINLNSLPKKSRIKGNLSRAIVTETDREATDGQSEVNRSQNQPYMAKSSRSSSQQQGLSQFEQLVLADSRELLASIDGFEMQGKTETLKQMLNLSVQRFLQKQNYCINDFHLSKTKQQLWMINNSIDFAQKTIKQFHIIHQQEKTFNPYYNYFLITSQNAKINSNHFEQVYNINTQGQWKKLNDLHLPLHQWQKHLKQYLLHEAKIVV